MSFAQVLRLAQEMETVGERAYRHFAEQTTNPRIRELFTYLADEEVSHRRFFHELHDRVLQSGDPGGGLTPDKQREIRDIVAATPRLELDQVLRETADCRSPDELLRKAIEMEKAVIAFFQRTRICIGDSLGEETVDAVINEELKHIKALEDKLSS